MIYFIQAGESGPIKIGWTTNVLGRLMDREAQQRAKEAECAAADDRNLRSERYALQTPSGNIVGMGTEKPKLTKEDRRNFWKAMRLPRRR